MGRPAILRSLPFLGAALLFFISLPAAVGQSVPRQAASLREVTDWEINQLHPLALEGTLTLVDMVRGLLVLQDESGPVALHFEVSGMHAKPGDRVRIEAEDSFPFLDICPGFPFRPARKEVLQDFEVKPNWQVYRVERLRGRVQPPVTGDYVFWITSDDSSELFLGENDDPASAKKIAFCPSARSQSRDWDYLPAQRSASIHLIAGRNYYIEALYEQMLGSTHLSVAWQIPGRSRDLLNGEYLSPWSIEDRKESAAEETAKAAHETIVAPKKASLAARGILREQWTNTCVRDVSELTRIQSYNSALTIPGAKVTRLGSKGFPSVQTFAWGAPPRRGENYRWGEAEGTVNFVSVDHDKLVLELATGTARVRAVVLDLLGETPHRLKGARVRVQGVAEAALNAQASFALDKIWVPSLENLEVLEHLRDWQELETTPIAELRSPKRDLREERVRVKGKVRSNVSGTLILEDEGSFLAYFSPDGEQWKQVGPEVEVPMADEVLTGLAVSSRSAQVPAKADFDGVTRFKGAPRGSDVGEPSLRGSFTAVQGSFALEGAGFDIWDAPDQFYFVHEHLDTDGVFVAHLKSFRSPDAWAKTGIMMRESLAPTAPFVDLIVSGGNGVLLQWRRKGGGSAPLSAVGDGAPRPPCWLKLERRHNSVKVLLEHPVEAAAGARLDAAGFVSVQDDQVVLTDASCAVLSSEGGAASQASDGSPLLTIGSLPERRGDVNSIDFFRVRGVVTFSDKVAGVWRLSIQDATGGTFIYPPGRNPEFRPAVGQFVEVVSRPTWEPPPLSLTSGRIVVLGEGQLPSPAHPPFEYNLSRHGEATWVEVEGLVRWLSPAGFLELWGGGETFTVAVAGASAPDLRALIGARVRLRGVISSANKNERQLLVPGLLHVEVLRAAPADPFAAPLQPIQEIAAQLRKTPPPSWVRTSGVITYVSGLTLYAQDEKASVAVQLAQSLAAAPGDRVEIVGFPQDPKGPVLTLLHAETRVIRRGEGVPRAILMAGEKFDPSLLGSLVRLRAPVSRSWITDLGENLELIWKDHTVRGQWDGGRSRLDSIDPGALVEVTGVCIPEAGIVSLPAANSRESSLAPFRILLRTAADVVVLQRPRWWVVRRTLIALAVLSGILVVASVWIRLLRRRVNQRTKELELAMKRLNEETRVAATLAERNRLACEIHDSLQQGLSGLSLQLEATGKLGNCPEDIRSRLSVARNMVSFSRAEVQHAVWDLQSPILVDSELGDALKKVADQIGGESPHLQFQVVGTPLRLSSAAEHHLLRIAQEGITNAIKHARASKIEVALNYSPEEVVLLVHDNGCGFSPNAVFDARSGHFGLRSLRGRANKIGAEISIISAPEKGTCLQVRLPSPRT